MLPFLKPDKMGAVIMAKRKPSGAPETMGEKMSDGGMPHDPMLHAAAEELMNAIHSKDAAAVASAFQAAFNCLEQAPHEEFSEPESSES